jgi:hypothetical protein
MPTNPPLFDDGGELPETASRFGRRQPMHESPASDRYREPLDRDDRPDRHPNYLARRAAVIGVALVVIVGAGFIVSQVVGQDDGATSTVSGTDWDTIVVINDRTGDISLTDADGNEIGELNTGIRQIEATDVAGPTLLLDTGSQLVAVDLDDLDSEVTTFEIDGDRSAAIYRPSGTNSTLLSGTAARAILLHGPTGDVVDTDEFTRVVGAQYDID